MRRSIKLIAIAICIVFTAPSYTPAQVVDPVLIDKFGDVNCEDEMARLDNYAIELQNKPQTQALIIVYGSSTGRRNEAVARASRIKSYLVKLRGLNAQRIVTMNGGYQESLKIELWLMKAGTDLKQIQTSPTVQLKDVKFKKGKIKRREYYQCGEM